MASRQSFWTSRQELTFEACLERYKLALEQGARAGYVVQYEDNDRLVGIWRMVTSGRPSEVFGTIVVMTTETSITRLKYVLINRAVLESATIEQPAALLLAASAIDRAVLAAANRPSYRIAAPGLGEGECRTYAQLERRGRLYTLPALDDSASPSASFMRWSQRVLTPAVSAVMAAGYGAGVLMNDVIKPGNFPPLS